MKIVIIVAIIIAVVIAIIATIAGVVACIEYDKMMKSHSEKMKKMSDNMIQIKKKD